MRADPDNPLALREHIATAVALGYATVATDTRVDAGDKAAGREIARGLDPIDPAMLASALADASARTGARPVLNRLTRLTIRFGEPGELQRCSTRTTARCERTTSSRSSPPPNARSHPRAPTADATSSRSRAGRTAQLSIARGRGESRGVERHRLRGGV